VGYTTLTVGWTRPADDGGSEIVGFVVQARELSRRAAAPPHLSAAGHLSAAQNASYSCIGSASASQCELAGLLAGTSYELRVAARNSVGVSAWSPDVTNKTLAPTAPGAPGEPLSSASDPYELVWEAAADHGAVIEAYDVQMDDWWTNSTQWRTVRNASGASLDARSLPFPPPNYQEELLPDSVYKVRVAARNGQGVSPWSLSGSLSTTAAGACGNHPDLTLFRDERTTLHHAIMNGLIACLTSSNRTSCAIGHVEQLGLSYGCSICWAEDGLCTLSKCIVQCLDPSSAACLACSREYCSPALNVCTGVPKWAYPT